MKNYEVINRALEEAIRQGRREFAIYPFGKNGIETKEILNWRYGIEEAIIVDNQLSKQNTNIYSLNEVKNYNDYTWLLTCDNEKYRHEIESSISNLGIEEENVINIFKTTEDINASEYRVLSKIGLTGNSTPCKEVIEWIERKKKEERKIVVAEIGVDIGATAVEICKRLQSEDEYYCFDYEDKINNLLADLRKVPGIQCKLKGEGNSHKTLDSYNWSLCKLLFAMKEKKLNGVFDIVYLDGAHNFIHDGLACCILKELIKKNGIFIFDDVDWSIASSPTCNPLVFPEVNNLFTEEQINDYQVERVIKAFMCNDEHFSRIYNSSPDNNGRMVFVKNQ